MWSVGEVGAIRLHYSQITPVSLLICFEEMFWEAVLRNNAHTVTTGSLSLI